MIIIIVVCIKMKLKLCLFLFDNNESVLSLLLFLSNNGLYSYLHEKLMLK